MTTAAQIRRLSNPLLKRHKDLVLSGQWLIVLPVDHLARFVLFDRTSSADRFSPLWGAWHLFDPEPAIGISLRRDFLFRGSRSRSWSDPEALEALPGQIEEILPALRAIRTIEDYLAFGDEGMDRNDVPDIPHPRDLVLQLSLGNIDEARKLCGRLEEDRVRWDYLDLFNDFVTPLAPFVMSGDREGIARQLHAWEFERSRNPVLRPYWERTPFPFELAGP